MTGSSLTTLPHFPHFICLLVVLYVDLQELAPYLERVPCLEPEGEAQSDLARPDPLSQLPFRNVGAMGLPDLIRQAEPEPAGVGEELLYGLGVPVVGLEAVAGLLY